MQQHTTPAGYQLMTQQQRCYHHMQLPATGTPHLQDISWWYSSNDVTTTCNCLRQARHTCRISADDTAATMLPPHATACDSHSTPAGYQLMIQQQRCYHRMQLPATATAHLQDISWWHSSNVVITACNCLRQPQHTCRISADDTAATLLPPHATACNSHSTPAGYQLMTQQQRCYHRM